MRPLLFAVLIALAVTGIGLAVFYSQCPSGACAFPWWQKTETVTSFERCAALGYPVTESYPRTCALGTLTFTEALPPIANDMIRITSPLPYATLQTPLRVRGEARGSWYFEATFPVRLLDANGKVIASAAARAGSNWMTNDFVPFDATLVFATPMTQTGTLVLEKDTPSGLPQNAVSVAVPVRFVGGVPGVTGGSIPPERTGNGVLHGTMTIGPICPVEQVDTPCSPTREMYAAQKVYVYKPDQTTLVTTLTPDANGNFSAVLTAGTYYIDMNRTTGPGGIRGVPTTVVIRAGVVTEIAIDVDTGIR